MFDNPPPTKDLCADAMVQLPPATDDSEPDEVLQNPPPMNE